jgi:dihydrofolate reductase
MCKLIYPMTVSLDGYICGPQGEFDWAVPDEELHRFHNDQVRELGGHLLGRRLYEVMSFWETAEERNTRSSSLASGRIGPRFVYSNTLTRVEGKTRLSSEDPVAEVPRLKEQPEEPLGVGGANLAATLMRHDLIDEYRLS